MKNTAILFCFFFLPCTGSSQTHTSVDIIGGYEFLYKDVSTFFGSFNRDNSRLNYRIGGNFNFRIFDRRYIKTGIRFVSVGNLSVVTDGTGSTFEGAFDEYYVEIPLLYRYEFNEKKFSLFSEVGVSPHLYTKGKLTQQVGSMVIVEDFDQPHLEDKRIRMAIVIAFGMHYNLTDKYQVFIQPTYRHFFPANIGSFITITTINLGIEIGVRRAIRFVNDRN